MKLSIFLLLPWAFSANAIEWVEKRQITSLDIASLNSQIASLTQLFGPVPSDFSVSFISTPGGNLLAPPATLIGPIITAVPATVIAQLLNPSARSSIAADFKAGSTPAWFATLPVDVKSYISALNAQITAGGVTITGAAQMKTTLPVSTGALNSALAKGSNLASEFAAAQASATDVVTSTSKALAPSSAPISGLAGSVAGVVGAFGVFLFL